MCSAPPIAQESVTFADTCVPAEGLETHGEMLECSRGHAASWSVGLCFVYLYLETRKSILLSLWRLDRKRRPGLPPPGWDSQVC